MADFNIKITGLDEFLKKLNATPQKLGEFVSKTMGSLLMEYQTFARKTAPIRTGELRKEIGTDLKIANGSFEGRVFAGAKHSVYVELGTGLFGPRKVVIRPVSKKALYWKGATHPVKSVKGQRAQPYMKPTYEKAKAEIGQKLQVAMVNYINYLTK